MEFKALRFIGLTGAVVGVGLAGQGPLSTAGDEMASDPKGSEASIAMSYGSLPVSFAPNRGQAGEGVDFVARGTGYGLALHPTGAVLALTKDTSSARIQTNPSAPPPSATNVLGVDVLGGSPATTPVEQDPLSGRVNYLTGDDQVLGRPMFRPSAG